MEAQKIKTEKDYRNICSSMDLLIDKGTQLGDMELLSDMEKNEYVRLSALARNWKKIHYPHPIPANPLIARIQERI